MSPRAGTTLSSKKRSYAAGRLQFAGNSQAKRKAPRTIVPPQLKRKPVHSMFPRVHVVGGQEVGDRVEVLFEPIALTIVRFATLEECMEAMDHDVLAVIAIAPIDGYSMTKACQAFALEDKANEIPLLCIIPNQPDSRLVRALYKIGAQAVFEWPSERANLVPYVRELLLVGPKEVSPDTKDRELKKTIITQLACEQGGIGNSLSVTVSEGVVSLSGSVEALWQLKLAQRITAAVPGVCAVLSPCVEVIGKKPADCQLAERVRDLIQTSSTLDLKTLEVSVKKGVVNLRGSVANGAEVLRVEDLISHLHGVRDVRKTVVVSPAQKRRDGRVAREIEQRVLATRPKGQVKVAVFGGVVVLKGSVSRLSTASELGNLALRHQGISRLVNKLTVRA